jgi:AraC-like DNA-binding protein
LLPLGAPPRVLQMGRGIHGSRPVERYRLEGLWCVHLYGYAGQLRVGAAAPLAIRPGAASVVPPDTALEHHFGAGRCVHLYAHFAAVPADTAAADAPASALPIPAIQDLGDEFGDIYRSFEQALGYFPTRPRRAAARLWDILWQIAERGASGAATAVTEADRPKRRHPAVEQALQIIELRLAEPLCVADLARQVDLSQNHLTRLFRGEVGSTVVGYVRQRRAERARHLLLYSTLPIKAVAAYSGFEDLQHFNKAVRRLLGRSPRNVRQQQQSRED